MIICPSKYGGRHQNWVDSLFSYRVIDTKHFVSNGGPNLHILRIGAIDVELGQKNLVVDFIKGFRKIKEYGISIIAHYSVA